MDTNKQRIWFCIDKRITKPSRPACYSIIYDILPGYSTGSKQSEKVTYVELITEVGRAKSLSILIEQSEQGMDLNIKYTKKKPLIKGMTEEEALTLSMEIMEEFYKSSHGRTYSKEELVQISFDYLK